MYFTGYDNNGEDNYFNGRIIEVVDVLNPNLVCDIFGTTVPVGTYAASGGKIGEDFLFCGGYNGDYLDECYILGNEEPFIKMNDKRYYASGVVLPNGTFVIIGKIQVFKKKML